MEQEGEKGREERRQVQRAATQQPPQQHQKCPRCGSMNTKFCYFNNYSLSQPRHFCKTCKRYWTHGGTFRNIPVGGGSRKVKRGKTNSSSFSSSSSSSSNLLTQPQQNLLMRPSPPLITTMVQSTSPYYHLAGGSGYLSSLATLHSLNNNTSQPFNQYLKVGGDFAGSSNSPLVSGFNAAYSLPPRFPQQQSILINNVSTSTNHRASISDASLWSAATVNTTSIGGNSDQNNVVKGGSSSLVPSHWLHRPGFGPPQ
ncbi:hypothetical protein JHK87_019142 [Glycine soja]|nr:hypothetical protein JHK87_019142 [Glycine soja]